MNRKCGLFMAQHTIGHWRLDGVEVTLYGRVVYVRGWLVPLAGWPAYRERVMRGPHRLHGVVILYVHPCYVYLVTVELTWNCLHG